MISPNRDQVLGPSSDTLSNLAGSISSLENHLQERGVVLADQIEEKRDKYKLWPDNRKKMLLNAMTVDGVNPASSPPASFLHIVNERTVSKEKEEIEALLAQENCMCDIPISFVAAIQSGDFIVWGSDDPGKLRLFALGMNKSSDQEEETKLKMQLMSTEGRGFDREMIDLIVSTKTSGPGSACSLKHLFKTSTVFFRTFLRRETW